MRVAALLLLLTMCRVLGDSILISSSSMTNAQQPQIAADRDGAVYIAFGCSNLVYEARSTDGGRSFSAPVEVGSFQKLALGRRRGPRIVANIGTVVVTAIAADEGNLYAWRSTNSNQWSEPVRINDVSKAAREGLQGLAGDGDHKMFAVWLDLRDDRTELWGSASENNGQTWAKNFLIYRSPAGHICECCHPSVTFLKGGAIAVMWRNWLHGARDMYVTVSHDGGKKFGDAEKLGRGTWTLSACPMDGGALVTTDGGEIVATWRRESSIYASIGNGADKLIGGGYQPVVAQKAGEPLFVWQRDDALMMKTGWRSTAKVVVERGQFPAVTSVGPSGAVLVWEAKEPTGTTIKALRIE